MLFYALSRQLFTLSCLLHSCSEQRMMAAMRLENVTQTIGRILKGYDIRLRPNFGGEESFFLSLLFSLLSQKRKFEVWLLSFVKRSRVREREACECHINSQQHLIHEIEFLPLHNQLTLLSAYFEGERVREKVFVDKLICIFSSAC
jgi:hypothetical protein